VYIQVRKSVCRASTYRVCCSVLQCAVGCCSVLQRVTECIHQFVLVFAVLVLIEFVAAYHFVLQSIAVCCSVLIHFGVRVCRTSTCRVCCSKLQCVAVCRYTLVCVCADLGLIELVAAYCSVLQCVAVRCSVLQ